MNHQVRPRNIASGRNLIMLELNELCPKIIDRMVSEGRLPNFKRLQDRSIRHLTRTSDQDLEPWVQWVTLHSGMPQSEHGVRQLDERGDVALARVWDSLASNGYSSVIFGSMNTATKEPGKVSIFPDFWSSTSPSNPSLKRLHRFLSDQVLNHTDPNKKHGASILFVLIDLIRQGVSVSTMLRGVAQLLAERVTKVDLRWRRPILLDEIMWDLFEKQWSNKRPNYATFFANSTAFLQHRYWRHMEPEVYIAKPTPDALTAYGGAIEASYERMDVIVGKALRLVGDHGAVAFSTAISQEANLKYEDIGGKFVYRCRDFWSFFQQIGAAKPVSVEPVMTHQAWATFDSTSAAQRAGDALAALTLDDKPLMNFYVEKDRVFFDCALTSIVDDGKKFKSEALKQAYGVDEVFHLIGQVNNSQHSRLGYYWRPAVTEKPAGVGADMEIEDIAADVFMFVDGHQVNESL